MAVAVGEHAWLHAAQKHTDANARFIPNVMAGPKMLSGILYVTLSCKERIAFMLQTFERMIDLAWVGTMAGCHARHQGTTVAPASLL